MVGDKQRALERRAAMVNFARAAVLRGFAEVTAEAGVDPVSLCQAVGIPPEALSNPDARIRCDAFGAVLDLAARRTRLDDFALRMAQAHQPSTWGAMGLFISTQETLGQALAQVALYVSAQTEEIQIKIEPLGEDAVIWFDIDPGSDAVRYDPTQKNELAVAAAVYVIRRLLNRDWRPLAVGFTHAARGELQRYWPHFGCIPVFDQERLHLLISKADLDIPLAGHDPEASRLTFQLLERQLLDTGQSFSRAVAVTIAERLGAGAVSADGVAEALGFDLRAMQRRLAAEGSSFSQLLHAVRKELARTYVEGSRRPLAEVADLLGFASLSAFSQWYRRAHGQSAAERRRVIENK